MASIVYIATYAVRKRKSGSLISTKLFNTRSKTAGKVRKIKVNGKMFARSARRGELMSIIKKISQEETQKIIDTRQPIGLFYTVEITKGQRTYIGIDNSTGDAWVEEFNYNRWGVN